MNNASAIDEEDKHAIESFKEMLSFYGLELQSHAAIILGLALLIFALVQTWGQLQAAGELSPIHAQAFSWFVGLVGAGIVHQIWRLYVFGKLASALMYGSIGVFNAAKDERSNLPEGGWEHAFDLFKVSVYAERMLRMNANLWLKLRVLREVNQRVRLRFWVLIASFEAWFALSYGLIFGTLDVLYLTKFVIISGLTIGLVYRATARLLRGKSRP